MVKVNLKHNQNRYADLDIDVSQPVVVLKGQLWTLTGVPIERQKVMIKGLLHDDADLSKIGIKEGQSIVLLGTPEDPPKDAPHPNEILTPSPLLELAKVIEKDDEEDHIADDFTGLPNLGNTCFVNSVLQFLTPMHKMKEFFKNSDSNEDLKLLKLFYTPPTKFNSQHMRTLIMRFAQVFPELFTDVNPPSNILKSFPAMAKLNTALGGFAQQDAEQFLSVFLNYLKDKIPSNMIDSSFNIKTRVDFIPQEEEVLNEVKNVPKYESFYILQCHLGTTNSNKIYTLQEGINLSMNDIITKHSDTLNRNAKYQKKSKISKLPEHLIIHFVRFEWKMIEATLNTPTKGSKTKICRRVVFPNQLDMFDFCTEDLQKELNKGRKLAAYRKDMEVYTSRQKLAKTSPSGGVECTGENVCGEISDGCVVSECVGGAKVGGCVEGGCVDVCDLVLSDGKYELCSVITHQGRTADTGHYIAWINLEKDEKWLKCDDENLTVHTWPTLDLAGGRSDYHIAYLLMYKKIPLILTKHEKNTLNL